MRPGAANTSVRPPAVAGLFYPGDADELRNMAQDYLRRAPSTELPAPPKALIVPHAGYVYSGIIAAAAYALLTAPRREIRTVVLIGPSHRVYLPGIAVPAVDAFATPLGRIAIDQRLKAQVLLHAAVIESDVPHQLEHSLEVQLPFLQLVLDELTLLPLVLGAAPAEHVAAVLESVWGDRETLVLASSDLSHYHRYEVARQIDAATRAAILRCETRLSGDQACGAAALNGLLHLARRRGLQVHEIAHCNSADTAGDRSRVVGYGAFALNEAMS
jgi:MEMO1 family protein